MNEIMEKEKPAIVGKNAWLQIVKLIFNKYHGVAVFKICSEVYYVYGTVQIVSIGCKKLWRSKEDTINSYPIYSTAQILKITSRGKNKSSFKTLQMLAAIALWYN